MTATTEQDERCDEGHWCCPWIGLGPGDHDHFMLPSSCAACAPHREQNGSRSLAARHQEHYRSCNCLGDGAECCVPDCECHGNGRSATRSEVDG